MTKKQKAFFCGLIFLASFWLGALFLNNKLYFPDHQTQKVFAWQLENGVETPFDQYGRSIRNLYVSNPLDTVFKVAINLVAIVALCFLVSLFVISPGIRVLILLISVPILLYAELVIGLIFGIRGI